MKAQELRIGNYYNEFGIPKQATSEFIFNLDRVQKAGKIDISVSDIELTEEWLLKFGLIKTGILFEKEKNSKFAVKIWEVGKPGQFLIFWGDNRLPYIEPVYVHQLQNLYFALTGEEL